MTRAPDLTNDAGTIRAWRFRAVPGVGPKDWTAGIVSWFIDTQDYALDPLRMFSAWYVGGASLRDMPGVTPANRHYPEAEFELNCFTLDPDSGVGLEHYERRMAGDMSGKTAFLLQPADIVFQWHGTSDKDAEAVIEAFIHAVVIGGLSPSRPVDPLGKASFDLAWRRRLQATVEHFTTHHMAHLLDGERRTH